MPETNDKTPETTSTTPVPAAKKPRVLTPYSIEAILMRAELALKGHQSDADIQSAMTPFNYDTAAIKALTDQLSAARALVAATTQSRGAQQGTTQQVKDAFSEAKSATATFALVCRELLKKEPGALASLGLTGGAAPQALAAFLLYADNLFTNALSAPATVKAILAARGYDTVRLTAEKVKIDSLRTANQAQEQAKGTAQNLTPQQKQTLTDLDSAVMTYRKLARRALKTRPQLLEKLGIKA